ncbi:MAG: matrixin family metalloprotease [Chthoniobacterales bacterium]
MLGTTLLFCDHSQAYSVDSAIWTKNRTVVMNLSLGGPQTLTDGFASLNASAADALSTWNTYLNHMQFSWVLASPLPQAERDYSNSAFFSSTVYGMAFGSTTLAITVIFSSGSVRTEADVLFNNARTWDSYEGPLLVKMDFHRVALHEFGHVLGLKHPDENGQQVDAIMNSRISDVDSLTADDIAGAHSLYDSGPAYLSSGTAPQLLNLSTRAYVGTGNNVLIGGFIIQGSQPLPVVIRALAHSLASQGITNPLQDSVIELHDSSGGVIASSDDWFRDSDAETIASYRLDPPNSLESALLTTLAPGNYTVTVHNYDDGSGTNLIGTALIELYELPVAGARLGNISTRGQVLTGDDVMIAGFIIGPGSSKEVIVRALGPSLAASNIPGALADPTLDLVNSSGAVVASNDNWQTDVNANRLQMANLAPTQPVESALDVTLAPGPYTAIVRGKNGGTGVGLVEVYDLSPPPN